MSDLVTTSTNQKAIGYFFDRLHEAEKDAQDLGVSATELMDAYKKRLVEMDNEDYAYSMTAWESGYPDDEPNHRHPQGDPRP